MNDIAQTVIKLAEEVSGKPITIDTQLVDVMDSLEQAQLAIELTEAFPDKQLVNNEAFFECKTIKELVDIIVDTK